MPLPDALDQRLFDQVRQWPSHPTWRELNAVTLAEISQQEGCDFATALLYARLRISEHHGPLIQQLERAPITAPWQGRADCLVGVVPGGGHRESPDSRECLRLVSDEIRRLGFDVQIVPTSSFGTLPENAAAISTWLRKSPAGRKVLVSLSKGGAETKLLLHDQPDVFHEVGAWIDASGLIDGSEWVTWLLDRRISYWGARCWAWRWRYPFAALEQLRRGAAELLDFDLKIPDDLLAVRIVGFPLAADLSHRYTRRSCQRLASRGPSDGMGVMLGDLTRWQGLLYPVWRADHFLRPSGRDMRHAVANVLRYVDDQLALGVV